MYKQELKELKAYEKGRKDGRKELLREIEMSKQLLEGL
jgi:hypothetical protein